MSVQQIGAEIGALRELAEFPLVEALFGRRSRRFALGGEIPDGPLAYRSRHEPVPLRELERLPPPGVRQVPGTVPSVFIMNYVQAHHLDLDFYDRSFKPGAYLRTHAEHRQRWHGGPEGG
jgi:hypothetical protein